MPHCRTLRSRKPTQRAWSRSPSPPALGLALVFVAARNLGHGTRTVACVAGPPSEAVSGDQGIAMLSAQNPFGSLRDPLLEIAGCPVVALSPRNVAILAVAGLSSVCWPEREAAALRRSTICPVVGIVRQRGCGQRRSGLSPAFSILFAHLVEGDGLDEPMYRYGPVQGIADKGELAQGGHRIVIRHWVVDSGASSTATCRASGGAPTSSGLRMRSSVMPSGAQQASNRSSPIAWGMMPLAGRRPGSKW